MRPEDLDDMDEWYVYWMESGAYLDTSFDDFVESFDE